MQRVAQARLSQTPGLVLRTTTEVLLREQGLAGAHLVADYATRLSGIATGWLTQAVLVRRRIWIKQPIVSVSWESTSCM